MPSEVDHGHVGVIGQPREFLELKTEFIVAEVKPWPHAPESKAAECFANGYRVILRVVETTGVVITRVAYDESDTFFLMLCHKNPFRIHEGTQEIIEREDLHDGGFMADQDHEIREHDKYGSSFAAPHLDKKSAAASQPFCSLRAGLDNCLPGGNIARCKPFAAERAA
jgi:hypothetical protein